MHSLSASDLEALNRVVSHLRENPDDLYRNELLEFRNYLESLGATLPKPHSTDNTKEKEEEEEENFESEPDEERWVLEDLPEDDIPSFSGVDPSPEDEEKAAELKAEAAECASEGKLDEAIEKMAQALRLVPGKAMYWSQRSSYLLDSARPGAALRDASRALSINPQNVRALRVRGTVNRHLGKWEEALKDLSEAQTIDYDERTDELLRLAQEKFNTRRKLRRQKEEEAHQQRQEALRRQREKELQEEEEERRRQQEQQQQRGPGGFPAGGMPAGGVPAGMEELFQDPEIMAALQDPEVAAKFSTLMQNPMAAMQMMGDPKMGPLMQKVMSKMMGGSGGMPGGFPAGGMPGGFPAGGMPGGFPAGAPPQPSPGAGASKPTRPQGADELD